MKEFNQKYITEEEIAQDVFNSLDDGDRIFIRSFSPESLHGLHFSLGTDIRNEYQLWHPDHPFCETGVNVRDGIDCSYNHPDAYSIRVIDIVWKMCDEYFNQELCNHAQTTFIVYDDCHPANGKYHCQKCGKIWSPFGNSEGNE